MPGSIGVGGSLSFLIAGWTALHFSWHIAFMISALGSFLALIIMIAFVPSRQPPAARRQDTPLWFSRCIEEQIGDGLCHRVLRAYLGNVHDALLGCRVPSVHGGPRRSTELFIPTVIAMLMEVVGTTTSIVGNELAIRTGRRRFIFCVMLASIACSLVVGFTAGMGYGFAALVCLIYNAVIYADLRHL